MAMVNPLFNKKIIMYIQLFVKKVGKLLAFLTFLLFQWFNVFLLHLMEIFPMTHNFWEKNIVKHWLTVVK